jgi:hypothetical protein
LTNRCEEHKYAPSLLERQSRGGDVAEGGFSFQESVVISYVPAWLAHEGFEEMTRESMGDAEAKFFVPGRPHTREFVEIKNHSLTGNQFWVEIDRFRELDEGSPDTFSWFTLVVKGLSADQKRLRNSLRRVRDPYSFYEGTAVAERSFADYAGIVEDMGRSEDDARFLFERVLIREDLTTDESQWTAVFHDELARYFPEYGELSLTIVRNVYEGLGALLRARRNRGISRREIEQRIRDRVPEDRRPPVRPVVVRTLMDDDEGNKADQAVRPIELDWKDFFGGDARRYPPPEDWDAHLVGELRQTKEWILRHRSTRRVRLTGNRRLSASLAVGAVFSAVAGFSVEMEYRDGVIWSTDAHPAAGTPGYPLVSEGKLDRGERLAVGIGILRDISQEVEDGLENLGLNGIPVLHLMGEEPIVSPEHANAAVGAIKNHIRDTLSATGAARVDLFLAGPAPLALFLGHRLNATARIRCYERVAPSLYVPTCELS